jgi:hypothetical protein
MARIELETDIKIETDFMAEEFELFDNGSYEFPVPIIMHRKSIEELVLWAVTTMVEKGVCDSTFRTRLMEALNGC